MAEGADAWRGATRRAMHWRAHLGKGGYGHTAKAAKKAGKAGSARAAPAAVVAEEEHEDDGGNAAADFQIQPSNVTPKLDTSKWPLLLKNYDTLNVRTGHYTPIPQGCSPLKREIGEYIRYVWDSSRTRRPLP
jgi:hypothetical protein